jgi:hypothetical protein
VLSAAARGSAPAADASATEGLSASGVETSTRPPSARSRRTRQSPPRVVRRGCKPAGQHYFAHQSRSCQCAFRRAGSSDPITVPADVDVVVERPVARDALLHPPQPKPARGNERRGCPHCRMTALTPLLGASPPRPHAAQPVNLDIHRVVRRIIRATTRAGRRGYWDDRKGEDERRERPVLPP